MKIKDKIKNMKVTIIIKLIKWFFKPDSREFVFFWIKKQLGLMSQEEFNMWFTEEVLGEQDENNKSISENN